jgi:hypothetical protein
MASSSVAETTPSASFSPHSGSPAFFANSIACRNRRARCLPSGLSSGARSQGCRGYPVTPSAAARPAVSSSAAAIASSGNRCRGGHVPRLPVGIAAQDLGQRQVHLPPRGEAWRRTA